VPLNDRQDRVARLIGEAQGILLPGSRFDVDPQTYGETPIPECAEPDHGRRAVDELLLQDAFSLRKPVLAICFGAQALNVWLGGSLIQHLTTWVDHAPGRHVQDAHAVRLTPGSRLAAIVPAGEPVEPLVNSSHHQAIRVAGDNLLVSAISTEDGVIEAIELKSQAHFVVAVQWHPERTYASSAFSRAIFARFVQAAGSWKPRPIGELVMEAARPKA
jgi:putative glutamine amidotransferase